MSADARRLSLSWPATLPAPTLSGATATYTSVLPGVDLIITADDQGGFSDVLVVHNATAAANPALATLKLGLATSGLTVTAGSNGDLAAAAGPSAPALFTAQTPRMWDSATPPATAATTSSSAGAATGADGSGQPAESSAAAPGAGAHTADVPVTVSGKAITLTPPASALTGASTVYPVYIDPTWHPITTAISAWTEVDSAWPTQSYWKESDNLQVGLCDFAGCTTTFKATVVHPDGDALAAHRRSGERRLPVHDRPLGTIRAPPPRRNCGPPAGSARPPRGTTSRPGKAKCSRNTSPTGTPPAVPGSPQDVTWDVSSVMQNDVANGATSQTFGIRAASESDDSQWKQFRHGTGNTTLTIHYNDPPGKPTDRSTNPGRGLPVQRQRLPRSSATTMSPCPPLSATLTPTR